jgi:hypothetical protein
LPSCQRPVLPTILLPTLARVSIMRVVVLANSKIPPRVGGLLHLLELASLITQDAHCGTSVRRPPLPSHDRLSNTAEWAVHSERPLLVRDEGVHAGHLAPPLPVPLTAILTAILQRPFSDPYSDPSATLQARGTDGSSTRQSLCRVSRTGWTNTSGPRSNGFVRPLVASEARKAASEIIPSDTGEADYFAAHVHFF